MECNMEDLLKKRQDKWQKKKDLLQRRLSNMKRGKDLKKKKTRNTTIDSQ